MKRISTLCISLTSLFLSFQYSQGQSCSDCRYISPIFDSVTMETVHFGRGVRANGDTQELYMDIYQPYNDTVSNRPLAIFAFGGAFITGSRDDWYCELVCNHLAKAGYVVASIDYRIYDDIGEMIAEIFGAFPPQQMRIFFRPMQDMRASVQYFKADYSELGNNYRIDTNKILIGGASSGAMTSLMTAYCDVDSEMAEMAGGSLAPLTALGGFYSTSGFYPNYSWNAAATFNVSGALINANWIDSGDIPMIFAHGDADPVVPYKKGGFAGLTLGTFDMEGSYLADSVARSKGVCSYLYTMEGRGHPSEDMGIEYFYSVVYRMMLRMKAVLNNQSFCCALTADITPGDTLLSGVNATPVTLNGTVTGDNGNASLHWCTMPCRLSSTASSITVTPDTTLRYVSLIASEGNCSASNLHIVQDTTVRISSLGDVTGEIDFALYPQPASESVTIKASLEKYAGQSIAVEVFDTKGRKVSKQDGTLLNHQLNTSLDLSALSAGTYFVTLTADGKKLATKKVSLIR